MKNKLVSVLIPLYNSEKFLSETLNSVLNQSYKNIEIIIINDGSIDNSLAIAKDYEREFENIIVYSQKNSGASVARNYAFKKSSGYYIQYLDSDDILDPFKIEMQVNALENSPLNSVAFAKVGNFNHNISDIFFRDEIINKSYDKPYEYLLDSWNHIQSAITVSWLTPRNLIEKVDGWNENISKNDDGDFFARIVYNSSKLFYVENSLAYYRVGNINSLSNDQTFKGEESRLNSYDEYMKLVKSDLSDDKTRRALAILYSAYIYSIYPNFNELSDRAFRRIKELGFKRPIKNTKNICTPVYYLLGFKVAMKFCKYIRYVLKK